MKIHAKTEARNRKHTVAANHHNKKHSTIHVHKGGAGSKKGKAGKRTILK
jgi:hypothetical protein